MNKSLLTTLYSISAMLTVCIYSGCGHDEPVETPEPTGQTYTVSFNTNGGSDINTQRIAENETANKPDDPTRDGYRFDGWYSDPSFSDEPYNFENTAVRDNITLYANWIRTLTITFDTNGGTEVADAVIDSNTAVAIPNPAPTREGHTFVHWYIDGTPNTAYDFENTAVRDAITFYANWEINTYTIRFNTNGGTEVASQTVTFGQTMDQPTNPSNEEHRGTFEGWYSDEELTTRYDDFDAPVTQDLTLYAEWSYMVTYDIATRTITGLNPNLPDGKVELFIPSNINGVMMDSIGYKAFEDNNRIISLHIAEGIKYIGRRAFLFCINCADSLTIPNSVVTIERSAFGGCEGFTGSLILGNSLVSIGTGAFAGCTFSGSLIIPNSVVTIGEQAFQRCRGFSGSLTIPNSVATIGEEAFEGMSFTSFIFESNEPPTIEGVLSFGFFFGDIIVPDENAVTAYRAVENLELYTANITVAP